MNTHSAILTNKTGTPVAFVDGIPDNCQHVWDGQMLYFNNEGEYFADSEVPDKKLNDGRDADEFYTLHQISGACASCSKCGKPFEPDIWI